MQDEINEIRAVRNSDGSGIVFIETEDRRLEKHVGNLDDDMDGAVKDLLVILAAGEIGIERHRRYKTVGTAPVLVQRYERIAF